VTLTRAPAQPLSPTFSFTAGRTLVAVQLVYVAWFALCAYWVLERAAHFAGHYYLPSMGDRYTANADITGGWPVAELVILTAVLGPIVSAVSLIGSIALLLQKKIRARRPLFVALLVSGTVTLVSFVVSLSPAGQSVMGWLLD
jgi:hypothetical protein